MIHLALRTEYSFRSCFGHIKETVEFHNGQGVVGIADDNNTYGHVQFEKACKEKGIKPIFGVRLKVVRGVDERARRRLPGPRYIFLAKNQDGLQELYGLVRKAWDRYYFEPMLGLIDVWSLSENIIVIAENYEVPERIDYIALTASTSKLIAAQDIPKVYINNNFYPHPEDRPVYELLAGSQKRGEEYIAKFEHQTYAQHIMGKDEFMRLWGCEEAAENTIKIAEMCNVTLPKSGMVKYHGTQDLHELCVRGAARKGIDLTDPVYLARYENEMSLIKSKEFTDYFLIVSDMIRKAKRDMLVGPSRGSSAGSLVCYLCDITEIDPIKHGLLFERFIAVNRTDLPDIDIDFPDEKREKVIEELVKTHNSESVGHIANINSFKPKSAIGEFAIGLGIPKYETDIVKDAIIERSGGDARAAMRVADTFDTTESGREFIEKYPAMKLVARIEGHANHAGTHAAGILVSNDPIIKYAGVDSRAGTAMIDKKDAEYLGLLKIDCLGLRTLTVLEDCAKLVKFKIKDFYTMPLDDPKAYQIFKDMRLSGIFQFEGQAMRLLCKQMGCTEFNDIVALTALARPGPLHSGGANTFIARRIGDDPTEYICDHPSYLDATKETYGVLIYQEQLIQLCRDLGKMDWADINAVRNAMSKSLGEEYFNKYRSKFLAGTRENDIPDDTAIQIWENMVTFGSWGMNKSHTVSYGVISYWCAYMKAHHPLEFAVANLNNMKSEESAIKLLRDLVENEGIEYVPVDPDISMEGWAVHEGKLYGGLLNIDGIGPMKAKGIIKTRNTTRKFAPGIMRTLMNPKTPFDILYPTRHFWGEIYDNPGKYGLNSPPDLIRDIQGTGNFLIIGKLMSRDLRDMNDYNELVKRGGQVFHENNMYLKLVVEDDTDQILCKINRFKFQQLNGQHIAESSIVGKTWFLIQGKITGGWRVIDVENILNLNHYFWSEK